MASFSGRVCESEKAFGPPCPFARSTVVLPRQHGVFRVACGSRRATCNALALRSYLTFPILKTAIKFLRIREDEPPIAEIASAAERLPARRQSISAAICDATLTAVQVGMSLTGAAIVLASKVVTGLQHQARAFTEHCTTVKQDAKARQAVEEARTRIQYELQRHQLEEQGKDVAFVKMLHVLDRCHLDLDVKWALVQKHTADKAEFSERLLQLYKLAEGSKAAVDHLLRPDATRKEKNSFWKSPETVAIIAEEDKLKSLVFAQMLQATCP